MAHDTSARKQLREVFRRIASLPHKDPAVVQGVSCGTMRYGTLGDSGLLVSEVGLGCNNFGGRLDVQQTRAVVDDTLRGDQAPAAELIDARPLLPGVPALGDGPDIQLWPHVHGTDAMYLALMRRTG